MISSTPLPISISGRTRPSKFFPFPFENNLGVVRHKARANPPTAEVYITYSAFLPWKSNADSEMYSPGGRYECRHTKTMAYGQAIFALGLSKINAPNWEFTFSDIRDDLSAILDAFQYFESRVYGVPQMIIEVYRYRNGHGYGETFLASQGGLSFGFRLSANMSAT